MGLRIALLLSGIGTDLSAAVCAVQLADRTGRRLYAIRGRVPTGLPVAPDPAGGMPDGFAFVADFAGLEGVQLTCHVLEDASAARVAEFLLANAVTCLVVGDWSCASSGEKGQDAWLDDLRRRLREAPQRFQPDLLAIRAPVLADDDLERIVLQSRRLKSLGLGGDGP